MLVCIDKCGMYGSVWVIVEVDDVMIDDYVVDVCVWVVVICVWIGVCCVWVLGYSEGGWVVLLVVW